MQATYLKSLSDSLVNKLPKPLLEQMAAEALLEAQRRRSLGQKPWREQARLEQKPPEGNWFVWMILSGRGWGKTRTGSETVLEWVRDGARHIALVGQTKADVRDTMVELGESSILKIAPQSLRPSYEPSKRRLTFPNGAVATIYSGDEPDQLRGPQHDRAWVDEFAKFKYPREIWNNLLFGLRLGDPRCLITTPPRPLKILKEIMGRDSTVTVQRPTTDNLANLSENYKREIIDPVAGTQLARQELEGQILEDIEEALWRRQWIDDERAALVPPLLRVVVGVDPAITSNPESAETGILVVGKSADAQGWVLGDYSLRGKPAEWAREAVAAFHKHMANMFVAEVNQGGEMVELTIHTVWPEAVVDVIHASRGKQTRAEPVAALYEQGRIHHVGSFPELEDQMCSWIPNVDKSPDRIDALVHAMNALGLGVAPVPAGTTEKLNPSSPSRYVKDELTGGRWGRDSRSGYRRR